MSDSGRPGLLHRAIDRFTSSQSDIEAAELRHDVEEAGCTPIADCSDRAKVSVAGTLRTVTLRPRGGVPALEAEVYDGSATVTVVWLGRRRMAGIEPGRSIVVSGRVGRHNGHRILFNPRYELRPSQG